jgi:transcriptional regulator with PAS, ATPase and Fis domain
MDAGVTLSRRIRRGASQAHEEAQLFLTLSCNPQSVAPARCSLTEVDEVIIGRSEARTFAREGGRLRIGLADPWMSANHVLLRRVLDSWSVEDTGSKNGTFLNGGTIQQAPLADSDLIEAGSTFFVFRESVPAAKGSTSVFEAEEGRARPLTTLLPALAAEFAKVETIARSSVAIVLLGESGVGKEVVASTLHDLSGRPGPFQAVNCAALPPNLVESELFGYHKGAFTGANEDRAGLLRAAHGGTLFLDEIGDLPLAAQGALLRVLQEKEVLVLGTTKPVKIDVRVIAATHRDLDALVAEQRFRGDMLARIRGLVLKLPALRERREDFGLLIRSLLGAKLLAGNRDVTFTNEAARALLLYRWPMNIRELEKCLETALVLAGNGPIDIQHLPPEVRSREVRAPSAARVPAALSPEDEKRREELMWLLREHAGNVAAVADAMKKRRMQVYRWVRRYGLRISDFR